MLRRLQGCLRSLRMDEEVWGKTLAPDARFDMKSGSNRFVTIDSVREKEIQYLLTV